jgi:hypothetical protein
MDEGGEWPGSSLNVNHDGPTDCENCPAGFGWQTNKAKAMAEGLGSTLTGSWLCIAW